MDNRQNKRPSCIPKNSTLSFFSGGTQNPADYDELVANGKLTKTSTILADINPGYDFSKFDPKTTPPKEWPKFVLFGE